MNSRRVVIIDFLLIPSSFVVVRTIRTEEEGQVLLVLTSGDRPVYRSWIVIRPCHRGQREFARDLRSTESRRVVIYMSWVQSTFMRQASTSPKSTSSNTSTVDYHWTHRPVMYSDRYIDCWLDFIISLWLTIFSHLLFIDYPALSEIKGGIVLMSPILMLF